MYFDNIVSVIYPSELQLALILKAHLSISNDIVSTTFYDTRDKFDFEIVHFQFFVPHSTSYGDDYISQLIGFAASSHVAYFNTSYKHFTQKLLKQGYLYHKLYEFF